MDSLPDGWSLVSKGDDVADVSILSGTSIVWTYKNGTWTSYIPSKDKKIDINARDGFWIKK